MKSIAPIPNADKTINPLIINDILRISPEPLRQFSDIQIHQLLCADLTAYLDYLDQGLREIGNGTAQLTMPAKLLFQQPGELGDFRVMPCVRTTAEGQLHKTVKLVGTNRAGIQVPDQISVGKACYLDPLENFVSHQFDACLLSSIRTGGCAALAARYLQIANQPLRSLALVGAGRVGFYTALCLLVNSELTSIQITDRLPERANTMAIALQEIAPNCLITTTDYAGLKKCDLLVLSTSSTSPIYNPEQFAAQVVISLGADCIEQRELHDHPLWRHDAIHIDTIDSLRFGDLAAWDLKAQLDAEKLVDITQLAACPVGAETTAYPALFISTGSALLDNLTMSYLVELTAET